MVRLACLYTFIWAMLVPGLPAAFAQSGPGPAGQDVPVSEQAQALWMQCLKRQNENSLSSANADYLLCNAVYNALGKAVASGSYGKDDVKWLYFYMGRTASSMAVIVLRASRNSVTRQACASIERADWTFQKVAAEPGSWEAEIIARYNTGKLIETCRSKFDVPDWRNQAK